MCDGKEPFEREIVAVRKYRAGYEVRTERVHLPKNEQGDCMPITSKTAYMPDGTYIGEPHWAHRLIVKRGIAPQKARPDHTGCSIGFCEREQKWYGWSHRAIYGFGIGYVAKEGDCVTIPGSIDEYLAEHPEANVSVPVGFEAKTIEDCKRLAIAFADSVG